VATAFAALLNKRIGVDRSVYSRGEDLELKQEYSSVYSEIPAAIQPLSSAVKETIAGTYPEATAKLYVEYQYEVREGDRVVDLDSGETYLVLAVEDAAGRGHHLEAWLAVQEL